METAHNFNERTPLLGNGAATNEQRDLYAISETCEDQTKRGKNFTSNRHKPLERICSNVKTSPSEQGTSASDTSPLTVSCPDTSEQKTDEVSLEEVAQALCSAWRRNSRGLPDVNHDFFSTKQLYAMHLAWKNVTSGRRCPFPAHTIVEAVALAVAKEREPFSHFESRSVVYEINTDKCILAVGLLRNWKRVTDGVGFPVRYTETVVDNPDQQPLAVSEFWRRQVELYDKIHDFILCRNFQCILHLCLIIWPLALLVVGAKYMDCPVSHRLSYLLISLGCIGCLVILVRFALMYLMFYGRYSYNWLWEWIGLRFIELIFLIIFIVQAFHFFNTYPVSEPGPKQCAQNFYNAALVINYVSIPLVSIYMLVYFIIMCANRFDFWRWLFRNF